MQMHQLQHIVSNELVRSHVLSGRRVNQGPVTTLTPLGPPVPEWSRTIGATTIYRILAQRLWGGLDNPKMRGRRGDSHSIGFVMIPRRE